MCIIGHPEKNIIQQKSKNVSKYDTIFSFVISHFTISRHATNNIYENDDNNTYLSDNYLTYLFI